jgi:hypothetical protein
VLLLSNIWCIPRLGVSCVDLNNSNTGAVTCNTSSGNSNHNNSNSLVVLLLDLHCRRPSGHHSNIPSVASHASTMGRWGTLLMNVASPSKATHHKLHTHGQLAEGPTEGPCTMNWPLQLHHRGGDSHVSRSASGYVLHQ